ncbi:FAD-binding protein [Shigella flexneri]
MEFVPHHLQPACQRSEILMTEGCRGEGGILVRKTATVICKITAWKNRWRAEKQIYGTGSTRQSLEAFWQRRRKGNTISTPRGDRLVHLDLRHLGEKKLHERSPFICELAKAVRSALDPVKEPIPQSDCTLHHGAVIELILEL